MSRTLSPLPRLPRQRHEASSAQRRPPAEPRLGRGWPRAHAARAQCRVVHGAGLRANGQRGTPRPRAIEEVPCPPSPQRGAAARWCSRGPHPPAVALLPSTRGRSVPVTWSPRRPRIARGPSPLRPVPQRGFLCERTGSFLALRHVCSRIVRLRDWTRRPGPSP